MNQYQRLKMRRNCNRAPSYALWTHFRLAAAAMPHPRADSGQLLSSKKGGPRRVEIGGREWPIEGEPIMSGPSDGGNGFLRIAPRSNASAFPWRFTKTFPTGK